MARIKIHSIHPNQKLFNILNYKPSPILRFGGSQSKSFQYMASGRPICANVQMGYCPITINELGLARNFADPEDYSNAILSFYKMNKDEYSRLCENSRKTSEKYEYKNLTMMFEKLL